MKAILRCETFHLRDPDDKARYDGLGVALSGMGLKPMTTSRGTMAQEPRAAEHQNALRKLDGCEVELDTQFLFDNQWNTVGKEGHRGLRVFDWHDSSIYDVQHVRTVQWLQQTEEMRTIRDNTLKCGYCGKQCTGEAIPADGFCFACVDSEYLKRSDLPLLRLLPISSQRGRVQELTEYEAGFMVPAYIDAQVHGRTERGIARIAKRRTQIEERHDKTVENARIERDGHRWILDNIPALDANAIFYNHTGRWSFGWNTPLDQGVVDELLDVISEFPFPYDIKIAGGKTLSGER